MCEIIAFPLVRRKRLIARLRELKPETFRKQVQQQADRLFRYGISEEEIQRQVNALCAATYYGGPHNHGHGAA